MNNLTISQLTTYRSAINTGGVTAARAVYSDLYSQGYNYAGWALGVATGNTITGQSALNYLGGTAMIGLGGDECRNLTPAQIDKIRIDMSLGYIDTLITVAKDQNGILNRDVDFKETARFHEAAFRESGLTLDNWTLNVPMEIIRRQQGDQAVEELWTRIRDTGGDGIDALLISTGLANTVGHASVSPDADVRQMAQDWIDKVPGVANWAQIGRFIDVFFNAWGYVKPDAAPSLLTGNFFIDIAVNKLFGLGRNWTAPRDPLVLDLDGDGIEAVGIDPARPILFDHDGDGTRNATGWIAGDDGLVVLDRNGNGVIDSGRELFGDQTLKPVGSDGRAQTHANGYEALAAEDGNGDKVIDANDAVYSQLRIWKDTNQDGISQAGELYTLADLGIARIGVAGTASNVNLGNGNTQPLSGSFTRTDGTTGASGVAEVTGSLLLASNNFYREFTDDPAVTAAAGALPQMGGSGRVRDLREAMSLPGEAAQGLQDSVGRFAAAGTRDAQMALVDELLADWAGTSEKLIHGIGSYDLVSDGHGSLVTADKPEDDPTYVTTAILNLTSVAGMMVPNPQAGGTGQSDEILGEAGRQLLRRMNVLEVFNGTKFFQIPVQTGSGGGGGGAASPGGGSGGDSDGISRYTATLSAPQAALLNQSYEELRESVYGALVVQTRLKPYLDSVALTIDEKGVGFDTTGLSAMLDARKAGSERDGLIDLVELTRYQGNLLTAVGFDGLGTLAQWIDALPAGDALRGELAGMVLSGAAPGTGHNDLYRGGAGNDTFLAGDGDDQVKGGAGDDQLYGGAGDDMLEGGAGNDRLNGGAGANTYRFGRGDGQDLIERKVNDGKIGVLRFKEGVQASDLVLRRVHDYERSVHNGALEVSIAGTNDKVVINGFFDNVQNGNGDPVATDSSVQRFQFADGTVWDLAAMTQRMLMGTDGADLIVGTSGNDTIRGNGGDVLYGAAGDDTLDGGAGNDRLNGGVGADTYRFGKGDGQDVIERKASDGSIGVLQFKDGVQASELVLRRVYDYERSVYNGALEVSIAGTNDKVVINGFFQNVANGDPVATDSAVQQIQFADGTVWDLAAMTQRMLNGTDAADTIVGTSGNDTLHGNGGNDALYGAAGDDVLYGGAGDDLLDGATGDDVLDGGAGNDRLDGGAGANTYRFGKGDGQDTIAFKRDGSDGKTGVLQFKEGLQASELILRRVYDTDRSLYNSALEVSIAGTNDKVVINGFFGNVQNGDPVATDSSVQQIQFADGTVWDLAAMTQRMLTGTNAADTIVGTSGNDTIHGNGGDDALYGAAGDDTLDGGAGNDRLNGGAGANTYRFGKGDGQDVIETKANDGKTGVLQLKDGVQASEVILRRVYDTERALYNSALEVSIAGTSDKVVVNGFFSNVQNGDPVATDSSVQQIQFADGTVWDLAAMTQRMLTGTDGADLIVGTSGNDTIRGNGGDDALYGAAGDDTLDGGAGNDRLNGGAGADTYRFGKGDGQDVIERKANDGNIGVLQFKDGVLASDVTLRRVYDQERYESNGALEVSIAGTADKVVINGFFQNGDPVAIESSVQRFQFADGTAWDLAAIQNQLAAASTSQAGKDAMIANDSTELNSERPYVFDDGVAGMSGTNKPYLFTDLDDADFVALKPLEKEASVSAVTPLDWGIAPLEPSAGVQWKPLFHSIEADGTSASLDSQARLLSDAMAQFAPPAGIDAKGGAAAQDGQWKVIAAHWQ
ncbi:RTX toxin [Acidovorax sp. SUPP3434]|uniref:calcium-binding protein n=1 Tax=Acidovorax sp. SUPP3434 TaxID=2920880 RepID=UPI0023DE5EC7|nr:calcium-binding protein [Acidovorax sp. SUPP3434]GKT01276.1 RTX toxin [Acidovorax sp. SUPP3434]